MRRSLPLAVQTDAGSIEHFWVDEVDTLTPQLLQQALEEEGIDPAPLQLGGTPLSAHTVETLSRFRTGLLLEQATSGDSWQQDLYLHVLAGPNTGYRSRLTGITDLSAALCDDHIEEGTALLHNAGTILLVTGHQRTRVQLETPLPLGNSVITIGAENLSTSSAAARTLPAAQPLQLPVDSSVPNRNYLYYLALAFGPLLIGAVLIVFTKMWFFLLFGVLSLFGGLIPYTQGRRAWLDYRTELHQRWQQACQLHQEIFGQPVSSVRTSPQPGPVHLTLGFGTQHPPVELPKLPRSLRPALPTLLPVGVTLDQQPQQNSLPSDISTTPHGLRAGTSLHIEATAAQHQGILTQLLAQLLPQLATRNCWIRCPNIPWPDAPLCSWLRFFPQLRFLQLDTDTANFGPGDVVICCGTTQLPLQTDADLITIVISDAAATTMKPHWSFDTHQHRLRFSNSAAANHQEDIHGAHISHLSASGPERLSELLRDLLRQPGTEGADPLGIETLPPRREGTAADLVACLGSDGHATAQDRHQLNLVADGPHMLIVGTTGSGKSVLLRRLIAEWVSRYKPSELNLVLVDFKGGATFSPFMGLAHTVAHLTDLDGENTPRLLTAIRSELKSREQLFAAAGVQDYTHYRSKRAHELPRIAVLIDEFAVFATEQPEALDELIHLATLGRSLGFHLVLATQRTGGHLGLGLRSNLSVKICLRVLNDNESYELIGTSKAAQLRPNQPGYAYIHTSGMPARPFRVIPHRGTSRPQLRPLGTPRAYATDAEGAELAQLLRQRVEPSQTRTATAQQSITPFLLPPLAHEQTHPNPRVLAQLDLPAQRTQPWFCFGPAKQPDVSANSLALIGHLCDFATARISHGAALASNTILLAGSHKEHSGPSLAGYATVNDAPTGVQMLSRLRQELAQDPAAERFLIIEELTRWLSACEQHRLYEVELIVADLLRLSKDPRSNLKILLQVDAVHSHHQLVNSCQHRLHLPRGIAEQQRLLWPRNVHYTEVIGRGLLTGVGLPEEGVHAQLLAKSQEPASVCESEHRWSPLPEHVGAQGRQFQQGKIFLGIHDLDHRPLYRHPNGLLAVIGPPVSGKTQFCRLVAEQFPDAIIIDDVHTRPAPELAELQTALASDPDQLVVVTTTPDQLRRPQLSFLPGYLHHGSHVLLRPHLPVHFDPFLLTPVPLTALPPGRGIFIEDGSATVFQAAELTENSRPEHTQQWPTRRSLRAREHSE